MRILPGAGSAVLPCDKFVKYALNPEKDADKAAAFEQALGYTLDNADELMQNIQEHIQDFEAVKKPDNGHGTRYEVLLTLAGANGKKANVITAWIVDGITGETRLTSAYVTKRQRKGT